MIWNNGDGSLIGGDGNALLNGNNGIDSCDSDGGTEIGISCETSVDIP